MKKSMIIALAMVFVLGLAGTAFAGPFADVPANHWAYDAVNKLAQAGIVDGYGDGTYRGDRTITRYEMAQMVAKAMERSDKADAANKVLINKLAAEFAEELDNLGVRVSTLEKKIGNITWTGQVREWYEWADKDDVNGADNTNMTTRILLWTKAPLNKDLTFIGRFSSWSNWGTTGGGNDRVGTDVEMDNAYIQGKNFTFGRQPITLGKGLVYNIGYNNDGATYTFGSDKFKVTAAAFKSQAAGAYAKAAAAGYINSFIDQYNYYSWYDYITGYQIDTKSPNVYAANITYQASDNLELTAAYAKSKSQNASLSFQGYNYYDEGYQQWDSTVGSIDESILDTWSVGFGYNGIKNITMTGEYGQNRSEIAKIMNALSTGDYDNAKAWVAQLKYKGAEWAKPHTYGFWVGYRDAEPGFNGITGDPLWETSSFIAPMNNVKGAEYGFDYTLFNNGVFTFNYMDFESNDLDKTDLKTMTAQLRYFF